MKGDTPAKGEGSEGTRRNDASAIESLVLLAISRNWLAGGRVEGGGGFAVFCLIISAGQESEESKKQLQEKDEWTEDVESGRYERGDQRQRCTNAR